jgi:hypothetical protein
MFILRQYFPGGQLTFWYPPDHVSAKRLFTDTSVGSVAEMVAPAGTRGVKSI